MSKLFDTSNPEYVANLYAKQMQYRKQGHALWQPSQVRIGDVGRLIEGRFHCLFNILEGPAKETRFEPLKLPQDRYVFHTDELVVGPHGSKSVRKVVVDVGGSGFVWSLLRTRLVLANVIR
jgi:hypothetical protein